MALIILSMGYDLMAHTTLSL